MSEALAELRQRLAALRPEYLHIEDDSALHAGHQGSGGGGHYRLSITSAAFAGQGTVARHRLIYQTVGDLIPGRVHALAIRALTPAEHHQQPQNP